MAGPHRWAASLGRIARQPLKARHHRRQQTQNHVCRAATLLVLQDEDEADDSLSRANAVARKYRWRPPAGSSRPATVLKPPRRPELTNRLGPFTRPDRPAA
jgi:hypothetical protein